MRIRMLMALLAAAAFILSACTGPSAQQEIYDHLEKSVTLEDAFREQQQPLMELEKKEQELYEQIIGLSMEEFDQIKKLSKEAAGIVDDRKEKLKLEKESIEAAKEEFDEIKPLIEDLDEEKAKAKEKANELYETMQKRYKAYQKLYKAYDQSLSLDAELYEMLQNKELTEKELQSKIESINESYSKVMKANDEFNKYTEQYNDLKKEFYKAAGIEVTYDESSKKESGQSDAEDESKKDKESAS